MSLTTRLSAFFLAALALVLVGFSLALYGVAHVYLHRQLDERLSTTLDTLAASFEINADGIEWEPQERLILLGQDEAPDRVRWTVATPRGETLGLSRNLNRLSFLASTMARPDDDNPETTSLRWQVDEYRLARRWLRPPAKMGESNDHDSQDSQGHIQQEGDRNGAQERRHSALLLTAALSVEPTTLLLKQLAMALVGLSLGVWVLAAIVGQRVCRRALAPLTEMAVAARAMDVADLGQRLPSPQTGDELQALGGAFNDLLTRVHEAFERQRRFTGDASHQLRTPLTAMLGQVEVVLRRDRSADEYQKVLGIVHAQAIELRHIVETLLFLARADAEGMLPDLEAVDLALWLPEYARRWADHPRGTDVRWREAGHACVARIQSPLLGQLLDNLLDNAFKYSQPGTPVEVSLDGTATALALTVADHGQGIAAVDVPHVFEPFYRSSRGSNPVQGGYGLGLAVARRIAVALGGTLNVASDLGQGSRFTLCLPHAPALAE